MDVAKAIALGAEAAGLALPFARAVVSDGYEGGLALAERIRAVLRSVMVLTGASTIAALRRAPMIRSERFAQMTATLREADAAAGDLAAGDLAAGDA